MTRVICADTSEKRVLVVDAVVPPSETWEHLQHPICFFVFDPADAPGHFTESGRGPTGPDQEDTN